MIAAPATAVGCRRRRRSVAGWTVKAIRNEPWLLVLMLPVLVITLTLAAIGMMVWFVFLIVVLALGRSSSPPRRSSSVVVGARARWAVGPAHARRDRRLRLALELTPPPLI